MYNTGLYSGARYSYIKFYLNLIEYVNASYIEKEIIDFLEIYRCFHNIFFQPKLLLDLRNTISY